MKFSFEVKYIPLAFLSLFLSKYLILGFDWTSVGFLLVLGSISGFYELKHKDKQIDLLHKRFELTDQYLTEFKKDLTALKETTESNKLRAQINAFKPR